jgi:hypothetical protein
VRKFALLTIALLLWTASPAAAASWTVSPGGQFVAGGGDVILEFHPSGTQFYCGSLVMTGLARAGTGDNPVAVFPRSPGAAFTDCTGPFGIVPEYTQAGDWTMNAETYDPATDEVTGTITNVVFHWDWAACDAVFSGSLDFTYNNTTGRLEILPNPTLDIVVDPLNDCLGIVQDGDVGSLANVSHVVPIQRFVP